MTGCEILEQYGTEYEEVMAAVFCGQPVDGRRSGPSAPAVQVWFPPMAARDNGNLEPEKKILI
jgi:hypothetical protein